MRVTYRATSNKEYWENRWSDIPSDNAMSNENIYPLKYALEAIGDGGGKILEAGCGAGRILRYFHDRGHDITGIDYIDIAVKKLLLACPGLKAQVGDVTQLDFPDSYFDTIFAFGLYHNIEHGLGKAILETVRVLKPGGVICASFRADNIQSRVTDGLAGRRAFKKGRKSGKEFHKINFKVSELKVIFEAMGLVIKSLSAVENMPFLYKFKFFRAANHKRFNENRARSEGYRLSWLGFWIQKCMMRLFPNQFCNIYVVIAKHK